MFCLFQVLLKHSRPGLKKQSDSLRSLFFVFKIFGVTITIVTFETLGTILPKFEKTCFKIFQRSQRLLDLEFWSQKQSSIKNVTLFLKKLVAHFHAHFVFIFAPSFQENGMFLFGELFFQLTFSDRNKTFNKQFSMPLWRYRLRGGFRGGGGAADASPSGIRPPVDPKGPPFDTFSEIHFWPTDPKIFLKAPSAQIDTNFEGERAPKKTRFFCQNFSKSAQKRLFWLFFFKFACGAESFAKIGAKKCFERARKINLVDLKKKVVKIFDFFWKSVPAPRENPRSAPVSTPKFNNNFFLPPIISCKVLAVWKLAIYLCSGLIYSRF